MTGIKADQSARMDQKFHLGALSVCVRDSLQFNGGSELLHRIAGQRIPGTKIIAICIEIKYNKKIYYRIRTEIR